MKSKLYLLAGLFLILGILLSVSVAAYCWEQSTEAGCTGDTDESCNWRADSWGAWCETKGCWNYNNMDDCQVANIPGKNCTWRDSSAMSSCNRASCWIFEGTNANTCVNNSKGLNCQWDDYCRQTASWDQDLACWNKTTTSSCLNVTGCSWGSCYDQGCWNYNNDSTCRAGKDWEGRNCTWNNAGWCEEDRCWNNKYNNQTACNAATFGCRWTGYGCEEIQCWNWDRTTAATCVNNTYNKSCTWDGTWCMTKDCWSNYDQNTCEAENECVWSSYSSSGYCEEVNCWSWDSWNGGTQGACEGNATLYGLNCFWDENCGGGGGCCFMDFSTTTCSNYTTERECMDSYYCWWEYSDWSNPSLGGYCKNPEWGTGDYDNAGMFSGWNPGCWVFDANLSNCGLITGCENSTNNACMANQTHDFYSDITSNGINCSLVADSRLCNNMGVLSSCCVWQNGTCAEKMGGSCWDSFQNNLPAGATFCEDYNAFTDRALCEQIAGDPYYLPCQWNNATERCQFKTTDVFGNGTQNFAKIDNQMNCKAAGGKWVVESYCEGNISVTTGRCEYKFDEETSCDKACFACEQYTGAGIPTIYSIGPGQQVNSSNAEIACSSSYLGYCEFTANTNAPNGIGYCKAKDQFRKGVATDCNSDCGACTYMGDSTSNSTEQKPAYYCRQSNANSGGGGCKWVIDNSTNEGGYCVNKGEKTCEDACDRCNSQTNCQNLGRTSVSNVSGSCMWQDGSLTCVPNIGEDVEICWDGTDNDGDGLIDCGDPACYTDSFCGLVEGDCFGWSDNSSCTSAGCEWVADKWGAWCDFKGSQCWRYDSGEATCNSNTNCKWTNGTGEPWCEVNWSMGDACMGLNRTGCTGVSDCVWKNDTWCNGEGANTEWCLGEWGGWCEYNSFQHQDCWQYQQSSDLCSGVDGCRWHTDEWSQPHCEMNFTQCWNYYDGDSCISAGCNWSSDSWGGWCREQMDQCWNYYNQEANCLNVRDNDGNKICSYGGTGNCQPLCFNSTNSQSADLCDSANGCYWKEENGWCEEDYFDACSNTTNWHDSEACLATEGCRWKSSGWCDPKEGGFNSGAVAGGGGMGGMGGECYKYDGNQAVCTNKSLINISCGWSASPSPECQVDWNQNCWQHYNDTECINSGCFWDTDEWGYSAGWCMNLLDQCWNNESLQSWGNNANWEDDCNANPYCNSTSWGNCEPACFSASTQAGCLGVNNTATNNSACRWITGWCNSAGMMDMFDNMEKGGSVPLGMDVCDGSETGSAHADLCGFGMKDMQDAWGIGAGVKDFTNASICNKEKITSHVMGAMGGGGYDSVDKIGTGNETVKFMVYLDADGDSAEGCDFNSTISGFEFRFRYAAEWNSNTSKTVETFNAYKCENSNWKATDIKISAWKQKMCSEIGGPMIAVDKADLVKFPTLYDSTADLRVFVTISDASHNATNPSDVAGPGWITPGSIDFDLQGMSNYGTDTAKFEDVLRFGFAQYEDCWNSIDDDSDGNTDCADWDCEYATICSSTGVNAAGYVDTSSPTVTGVKIEEYPDSALIMYDTNKLTNGTLLFYKNDSDCLSLNATVYDVGILKNNTVREYKLWHHARVYEGSNSLGYALDNDTTYYYKLRVCDSGGKCGVSKCSSFITSSVTKCPYCDFVTTLKVPSSWVVSYDLNQNGTYDHVQGQVCGPQAGMKTNYTDARGANVKLAKSDGNSYIEFINVTLTKTILNDKARNISGTGDVISESTGEVGLSSKSRDKIINTLHPERCIVKIPSSGTCDHLYQCDDNGDNCQDRTVEATLLDASNCIWEIPYCEFSTWDEDGNPAPSGGDDDSGGGGGSGAGGGGGGVPATDKVPDFTPEILPEQGDITGEVVGGEPDISGLNLELNWTIVLWAAIGVLALVIVVIGIRQVRRKKLFLGFA
ncbi:MAG: hypothetical protein ABIH72_02760 [archaeon]